MLRKLFFGEHLRRKGLLSDADLVSALNQQRAMTPTFVKVAAARFNLSMSQVLELYDLRAGSDWTIAEVALQHRYLDEASVRAVEHEIEQSRPRLGQVLVDLGLLEERRVADELREFEAWASQYREIVRMLGEVRLFRGMPKAALESLSQSAKPENYEIGETVVHEGDEANCFYCVVSGDLRVTTANPEDSKTPVYLTTIMKHDVFGESAIFEEHLRSATVTAETASRLLRIERGDFIAFLRAYPRASQGLLVYIIMRLLAKLRQTSSELAYARKNYLPQTDVDELIAQFSLPDRCVPGDEDLTCFAATG